MSATRTRRQFLLCASGMLAGACASSAVGTKARLVASARGLSEIEARAGGRLGVFAIDTGTGRQLGHRADERFAMCSTFKWLLAAAIFSRVDRAQLSFEQRVSYGQADLLEYAPVTRKHVAEGGLTVAALVSAAVMVSDNTAANLLLKMIDGPVGLTGFIRAQGDEVTRLDRDEPLLNSNEPGDIRDTTSPRAMTGLMRLILCGDVLSPARREHLLQLMRDCQTGRERLRAGFPGEWTVGDKSGSGQRGAINDVAFAVPPGRAPILVASYMSGSSSAPNVFQAAHADVARLVTRELGS